MREKAVKKKSVKKRRIKLTEEQKKQNAEERKRKAKAAAFRKRIRNVFILAGFEYINSTGFHMKIGYRTVELDAIFFYENILIICEDTTGTNGSKEHIRNKSEAFAVINDNFCSFISILSERFPEFAEKLNKYDENRYLRFCLYFSMKELALTSDDKALYNNLNFMEPRMLDYFSRMSQCIKLSAKYEIFRYLNVTNDKIGETLSESNRTRIKAPIIYPQKTTGLRNGVRVVSFMMSAEKLLKTCYVLRKDDWDESIWLYQRLLDNKKIKKVREFLVNKSESFFNNIIVALPDDISFVDMSGNPKSINDIVDFESCKIELPDEFNSICVIDGQHRIFAHYEGPSNDKFEYEIASLRKKLHLLVTGLIFPKEMSMIERVQIQSEIFLDINSNAKPVQADVLLHIETLKNPLSDIGLARRVIERLNKKGVFKDKFELTLLGDAKIKVASIIKFALRYLVTLTSTEDRKSLFDLWDGNKVELINKNDDAFEAYIEFCADNLNLYFSAVRKNNMEAWHDHNSKLLSVIAINGFIMAYNRQLKVNGIRDFDFFDEKFKSLKKDYSKDGFVYTSSQYRKFSDEIIQDAFGLDIAEV